MLSVTFCGAAVLKVVDQKTLVKRRWSYKVCLTVYSINTWRVCQTRVHSFTLSLSLSEGIRVNPQTSKTSESTASLSLAERWTIREIRRQLKSLLTYSLMMSFCNASVNSSCAQPNRPAPPLRAYPRALAFFCLRWQIPRGGDSWAVKTGTKKEGKCPVLRQHCNIFHWSHSRIVPF